MNQNSIIKKSEPSKELLKIKELLEILRKNKKQLLIFNGIVLLLSVFVLLVFVKNYYTSTIVILPELGHKTTLSRFGDLAALAGISVGEGASTEVYENLLFSESVLKEAIYAKYNTEEYDSPVNIIEFFEEEEDEDLPKETREREVYLLTQKKLVSRMTSDLSRKTKILTFSVTMPESKLSAEVANNIVLALDNYLRTKTKTYAKEQRFYIEKRVTQLKDSLTIAENELKNFREKNRVVQQSPMLLLEQNRLIRNLEILNAVYTELMKQLEIAKIDEIKDTPILNIREMAKEPVKKAGPFRANILAIIILISVFLSIIYFIYNDNILNYKKILFSNTNI